MQLKSVVLRNGHYLFNYKMGRVSGDQMQLSIFENKFSFHVFDLFCFWGTKRTACFPSSKVFTLSSSRVIDNIDVSSTMSETTPLCLGLEDIRYIKETSSQYSTKFQKRVAEHEGFQVLMLMINSIKQQQISSL